MSERKLARGIALEYAGEMAADANRSIGRTEERGETAFDLDAAIGKVTTAVAASQQAGKEIGLGSAMRSAARNQPSAPPAAANEAKDARQARLRAHLQAMSKADRKALEELVVFDGNPTDEPDEFDAQTDDDEDVRADAFYYGDDSDDDVGDILAEADNGDELDPNNFLGLHDHGSPQTEA